MLLLTIIFGLEAKLQGLQQYCLSNVKFVTVNIIQFTLKSRKFVISNIHTWVFKAKHPNHYIQFSTYIQTTNIINSLNSLYNLGHKLYTTWIKTSGTL